MRFPHWKYFVDERTFLVAGGVFMGQGKVWSFLASVMLFIVAVCIGPRDPETGRRLQ